MFMRDKGYDFIRFAAMMMIIIHHFVTTIEGRGLPELIVRVTYQAMLGGGGVALFFILSGAVLYRNYCNRLTNKSELVEFYKKRFLRIEIPHIAAFVVCVSLVYAQSYQVWIDDKIGFLISMVGLNYCNLPWTWFDINCPWIVGEWFTAVIVLLYILFPLLKLLFQNHFYISSVFVLCIFVLNLKYQILTGGEGWFSITNGIALFWVGMIYEKFKIGFDRWNAIIFPLSIVFIIIAQFYTLFSDWMWYLNVVAYSFSLFCLLHRIKYSSFVTKIVCKYNFELYLLHHRVFLVLLPIITFYSGSYLQTISIFALMMALTFSLAVFVKNISDHVVDWCIKKT